MKYIKPFNENNLSHQYDRLQNIKSGMLNIKTSSDKTWDDIHNEFHDIYGSEENLTADDFLRFLKLRYNVPTDRN